LDVAEVAWSVGLVRPNLTRERFERALNGRVDVQPERTWSWAPKPGTFTVWLRHNGAPVGSIEWVPGLSWKADRLRWLDAIVDGLNQDLGQKNPFPEPLPPRPRVVEPIMGDFNFATGEEIPEHAPWALEEYGFRCVIAPSFADIFYNNCFKNGMLPLVLPEAVVSQLFAELYATEGYSLTVDLNSQQVITPSGETFGFEVDAFRKHCLLNGFDDIGLTLQDAGLIRDYEARRKVEAPWLF
jgi:3-isopropylmalate/(R)-2-methylmalate dehydratase small subunit